jgi:GNAT superfamily N-acetyltransferase
LAVAPFHVVPEQVLRALRACRYAFGVEVGIELIPAAKSYPLRHAVLRPHLGIESVVWEGDEAPETATFGALDLASGAVIGVATVFPEPAPFAGEVAGLGEGNGLEAATWRLRGMATREGLRGQGIGSMVVAAVVRHVASRGGRLLWCNARVGAIAFYQRAGFSTYGEVWVIASVGPHIVMWRRIEEKEAT